MEINKLLWGSQPRDQRDCHLLLQRIIHGQLFQHFGLACLSNFPSQKHFVDHCVHFVEIKHQIQLAHVVEILVENLNKVVYGLEVVEVVVAHIDANTKVEAGIPSIDNLEVSELDKVCVLLIPHSHHCMNLLDQLLLLLVVEVHVPFG